MDFEFDISRFLTVDVAASLTLIVALLIVRAIAGHAIRSRTDAAPHLQRRWTASVRNLLLLLGVIGLVLIWAPQLRTFALSLTAVAVAIVVATKELILCLSGSFLRASTRAFNVGDWIEVAGVRGEVIDVNVFATTLQEFEQAPHSFAHTGRTIVVPNSAFLSSPIRNQTALREHTYHHFAMTLEPDMNVFAHRTMIEEVVRKHYAPYREQAARANAAIERRIGSDLPDPDARTRLRTTDLGKHRIDVTLFCPPEDCDALEDEITCEVMTRLSDLQKAAAADEERVEPREHEPSTQRGAT
jgi:hypothetical protein